MRSPLESPFSRGELEARIARERRTLDAVRDELAREPGEVNLAHVGRSLQRLSEYLRQTGQHEEAIALKDEAIAIWDELGRTRAHFLVRVQRTLALAQAERDDEAVPQLEALAAELEQDEALYVYRAFFEQVVEACADARPHA